MRRFASFALLLAMSPAIIAAKPAPVTAELLRSLAPMELRVNTIVRRIAIANVAQCPKQTPNAGMLVRVSYGAFASEMRDAMAGAFGFSKYPQVRLVVPGGPAERAGLRDGDEIVSFNDKPMPTGLADEGDAQKWSSAVAALGAAWDEAAKSPPTTVKVLRDGSEMTFSLSSQMACELYGGVYHSKEINASNAGSKIWINSGLLEYTPDDNEVASVVAHEAAHSILGHATPENEAKLKDPAFRAPAEMEADRLGVQLMANAGYDPYAAARYLVRRKRTGRGFFQRLTGGFNGPYMSPKDRIAFVQRRAEEVDPEHKLAPR